MQRLIQAGSTRSRFVVELAVMSVLPDNDRPLSLREQVEQLLPTWRSWYPSLFDAAADLGLIRARVCAPSLLMLSNRHAAVQSEALQAFKEQWLVEDEPEEPMLLERLQRQASRKKPRKNKRNGRTGQQGRR